MRINYDRMDKSLIVYQRRNIKSEFANKFIWDYRPLFYLKVDLAYHHQFYGLSGTGLNPIGSESGLLFMEISGHWVEQTL